MSKAIDKRVPRRIWLLLNEGEDSAHVWSDDPDPSGTGEQDAVEYVQAAIADRQPLSGDEDAKDADITRLKTELTQWRDAAEHNNSQATEIQHWIRTYEKEITRLREALRWALGEEGEFPERRPGEGAYWWRKELRERAALAPQGQEHQEQPGGPSEPWQPIATAPKKKNILTFAVVDTETGNWNMRTSFWKAFPGNIESNWDGWPIYCPPTHWMPLPKPPAMKASGEGVEE